jgi:hypothetical protein
MQGRAWVPVRPWGEHLGFKVHWDVEDQALFFDGREVPVDLTKVDGRLLAPVRDLAGWSGLRVAYRADEGMVLVLR